MGGEAKRKYSHFFQHNQTGGYKMTVEYRYCSGCGSTTHENQNQCVWCGAKMISECSNCKTNFLSPDFVHCPACGNKIEAPNKALPD
jgi:RNA polymerase subunit RPABC4/transcription elongation factor Spt4